MTLWILKQNNNSLILLLPLSYYMLRNMGFKNKGSYLQKTSCFDKSTPNSAVFEELCAFPLNFLYKEHTVKFRLKTVINKESIKYKIYNKINI